MAAAMTYTPYESGFDLRRGARDDVVGHVTIQETTSGVRMIRHRYDETGLVLEQTMFTPDEAIELSGALEAAARAVWERANGERN